MRLHFTVVGAGFLVAMAAREVFLALVAANRFENEEPFHRTWILMAISAACRMTGWSLQHLVVPLVGARDNSRWHNVGTLIAGPLAMAFMAVGLVRVLHAYQRLGYAPRLHVIDYALLIGVLGYVLYTGVIVANLVIAGAKPVDALLAINWATDPMLCALLIVSIMLRRSVLDMGGGVIARGWTAYLMAILLTTAGDLSQWAVSYGFINWPWTSLTWFIWYPAAAAYALGPAYQIEAIDRAAS